MLRRVTGASRNAISETISGARIASKRVKKDPLASHIFVSRRHYQNLSDTKSGKRRGMDARLSFNTACELGFRGSLDEWGRLMGAAAKR